MPGDVDKLLEWAWKIIPLLATAAGTWAVMKKEVADAKKDAREALRLIAEAPTKSAIDQLNRKADAAHERLDKHEDAQNKAERELARETGGVLTRLNGLDKEIGRLEYANKDTRDVVNGQLGRLAERIDDHLVIGRSRPGSR